MCAKRGRSLFTILFVLLFGPLANPSARAVAIADAADPTKRCAFGVAQSAQITPEVMRAALQKSSRRFVAYFDKMREIFQEREYVIELIEQAMLGREGVLLVGPPGNAKSMISDVVIGNIFDVDGPNAGHPSYFKIALHQETTRPELYGELQAQRLIRKGERIRNYEEGILAFKGAFMDEIFDIRKGALRHLLLALNERSDATGKQRYDGRLEFFIGASNKYMPRVYLEWGDQAQAVLDRFAYCAFIPGELEFLEAYDGMAAMTGLRRKYQIPAFSYADLDLLRTLMGSIRIPSYVIQFMARLQWEMRREAESKEQLAKTEYRKALRNYEEPPPPYRATKYHSPRTFGKALSALRAKILRDWIYGGGQRELVADLEDVKSLHTLFTLNGPNAAFLNEIVGRTGNAEEASQIRTVLDESEMFHRYVDQYARDVTKVVNDRGLNQLLVEADGYLRAGRSREAAQRLRDSLATQILPHLPAPGTKTRVSEATADYLAMKQLADVLSTAADQLEGKKVDVDPVFTRGLFERMDYVDIPAPAPVEPEKKKEPRAPEPKRRPRPPVRVEVTNPVPAPVRPTPPPLITPRTEDDENGEPRGPQWFDPFVGSSGAS